jgi:hypothetical protein
MEERNKIACLLAGIWKLELENIIKKHVMFTKEDVKHKIPTDLETR